MSAGCEPCLIVITRSLRRTSSAASATRNDVLPAFLSPMIEIIRVAGIAPPRDRGGTRGSVDGAERLQATPAGALGKKGVIATAGGAGDERAEQRLRNERHVPRDAEHRLGTSGHRRVDPA